MFKNRSRQHVDEFAVDDFSSDAEKLINITFEVNLDQWILTKYILFYHVRLCMQ